MKNYSWKDYAEYAKEHPETTLIEMAKHFDVAMSSMCTVLTRHGIRITDGRKKDTLMGIPKQEFIDYAKTHTIREIAEHFDKIPSNVRTTVTDKHIEYVKVMPKHVKSNNEYNYKIKRTGEAHDMIKTLSETYSCAAIARVFGYSKERIRQIVNEK